MNKNVVWLTLKRSFRCEYALHRGDLDGLGNQTGVYISVC